MKTQLPEAINTVEEATKFLTELHKNGEDYHPEDNAHDIVWGATITTFEEREKLNKLMQDIYNLEGNKNCYPNLVFDPCELLLDLRGHIMED